MSGRGQHRYVGVIGDGSTDREVLARIAGVLLEETCEVVPLKRQTIRDNIDEFWKNAARIGGCGFPGDASKRLSNLVQGVLYTTFDDFKKLIARHPSDKDIIILGSDAERHLDRPERYFEDWAWIVAKVVQRGIESFHATMTARGHESRYVPLVVPVITFPSTDIVVAALRGERSIRGKGASELKQQLYGTVDLRALPPEDFEARALTHISEDTLANVYRLVPEARTLLHILAVSRRWNGFPLNSTAN